MRLCLIIEEVKSLDNNLCFYMNSGYGGLKRCKMIIIYVYIFLIWKEIISIKRRKRGRWNDFIKNELNRKYKVDNWLFRSGFI